MWDGLDASRMGITFQKAHWLPIAVFLWFPITFVITYAAAVLLEDVPPVWPYISDTGTFPPEACIFGQLLNTGSILMAVVIYLRYRHVSEILATQTTINVRKMNCWTLWLGIAASFGVSIVGNFQETNALVFHLFGAFLAFGLGTVYQIIQSIISWKIYPLAGSRTVNICRIVLTMICIPAGTLTTIFGMLFFFKFDGSDITKSTKTNEGYTEHLCSAINEWIMAVCTMTYILTFANELRYIKVVEPEIQLTKRTGSTPVAQRY